MMPEGLPSEYIGDMYFNNGRFYGRHGIAHGNRSMGIAAGIQNNSIVFETYFVELVNDLSFVITLKIMPLNMRSKSSEVFSATILWERSRL